MGKIFIINDTNVTGGAASTHDIGTSALTWRHGYFSGLITAGTVSSNIIATTLTVGTVSATGNVIVGGVASVTGNIIGGATLTIGTVSATGNAIIGGVISAVGAMVTSASFTVGTGTIIAAKITATTGSFTALLTAGTASISGAIIGGANGSFATIITVATVSATGNLITGGTASIGGEIIGGTVITVGTVSATGNIIGNTTASGYFLKEGSNASMGTVTLVSGTANVATTKVTTASRIMLTPQAAGSGNGSVAVSSRTAGTSFAIGSTNILDDRVIAWLIFEGI